MKKLILIFIFTSFAVTFNAQNIQDPFGIGQLQQSEKIVSKSLFKYVEADQSLRPIENSIQVKVTNQQLNKWINQFDPLIKTTLPLSPNHTETLLLTEYNFFESNFEIYSLNDQNLIPLQLDHGIHYKGKLDHTNQSIASISIFKNQIYGTLFMENQVNYSIIPILNSTSKNIECTISEESKMAYDDAVNLCNTDDIKHYIADQINISSRSKESCKRISISLHADYDLYLKFNSNTQLVSNYIIGVFNNVHSLYKREDIQISLAEIIIHTSPDNFPHTSSNEDLDHFRYKYKNNKGNIALCISGFARGGKAVLGGIAYINTLCNKSYAYGYTNVNGTYSDSPNYSWDVFSITHELGHIFGSRHTHACVWGPNKNTAIDNCNAVEGSCSPGPAPIKGTIMSYCHQAGKPGIDFLLGFGSEPGNLIREKIKTSTCLTQYVPNNKSLATKNMNIKANVECFDGIYTHYYFDNNTIDETDDILLLSIQKNNQEIGSILDGSLTITENTSNKFGSNTPTNITAAYVDPKNPFGVINKYWTITPSKPVTNPVKLKIYFNAIDLADLKGSNPNYNIDLVKLFTIAKPGNPDPESNHNGVSSNLYKEFQKSTTIEPNKWSFNNISPDVFSGEFETTTLSGIGVGMNTQLASLEPPTVLSYLKAKRIGKSNLIEWSTKTETNLNYFIIERSLNAIKFDSIGMKIASKNSVTAKFYSLVDSYYTTSEVYYRIVYVNTNGQKSLSPVISLSSPYLSTVNLNIYPNPATSSNFTIEYNNINQLKGTILIKVNDLQGLTVKQFSSTLTDGLNFIPCASSDLNNGIYYLQLNTAKESIMQKFIVKK